MKTFIPDDIQQLALESYLLIRPEIAEGLPVTLLHIADEYSFIAQGMEADKPDNVWVLDIGALKTTREYFKHIPPTPSEVENAIQVVEDTVMPLHKLLIPTTRLYTLDASVTEIARLTVYSDSKEGVKLERADMESVFNRLAAIITGRPASQDILPTSGSFASTILILREVMHHLGFMEITVLFSKTY